MRTLPHEADSSRRHACKGDSPIFAAERAARRAETPFVPRKLGQYPCERVRLPKSRKAGAASTTMAIACIAFIAAVGCLASAVEAQQATVTTPFHSSSNSFFEQIGTQWGVRGPNFHFQFGGGPGMGRPAFGNPDPTAGIRSGWAWQSGPWSADFNFIAAQGNRSSMISQAPSVTLPQGGTGFFSDTSQSPFVIGFVPVVGGAPQLPFSPVSLPAGFGLPYSNVGPAYPEQGNPRVQAMLQARAEGGRPAERAAPGNPRTTVEPERAPGPPAPGRPSTAEAAAPSVAEARLMHQQEQAAAQGEAMQLLERGITAEESGKAGVARIYYRMAADRAEGPLREQIEARLNGLSP